MNNLHGIFDLPNALGTYFMPYSGYCSNHAVIESNNSWKDAARSNGAKAFKKKKKRRKIAESSKKANRRRAK